MQLFRAVVILVAIAMVALQYVQEWRRLQAIQQLPGPTARSVYEKARRRADRTMLVVTVAMTLLGVAAGTYLAGVWK